MAEQHKRLPFDPRRSPGELLEPFRRWFDTEMESSSGIRVEEFVDGQTMVVRAELPGIDPDQDVDVSVSNNVLHIKAERREQTEHRDKDSYRSEFRYGLFTRDVTLPDGVNADDVNATYRDGVLEVRTPMPPKPAGTPPRRVQINRG
jgi:HSP20 family protein